MKKILLLFVTTLLLITHNLCAQDNRHSSLGWDFSIVESDDEHPFCVDGVFGAGLSVGLGFPMGAPSALSRCTMMDANFDIIKFRFMEPGQKWWATWSIGLGMKSFSNSGDNRFFCDRYGDVSLGAYPSGTDADNSDLFLIEENFTLMLHRWISKNQSLGFGALYSLRDKRTSFCRSTYKDEDGKRVSDVGQMNGLYPHLFSLKLQYDCYRYRVPFFVYGRFTPMPEFKSGRGPRFSTLSFGIGMNL